MDMPFRADVPCRPPLSRALSLALSLAPPLAPLLALLIVMSLAASPLLAAGPGGALAEPTAEPVAEPTNSNGEKDALGARRLFFTATERRSGTADTEADAGVDARARAEEILGAIDGRAERSRRSSGEPSTRSVPLGRPPRELVFHGTLRVAERVQVLLGGGICRVLPPHAPATPADVTHALPLRCTSRPRGVRDLALLDSPPRLRVTLVDGRRVRLAVGDSMPLP